LDKQEILQKLALFNNEPIETPTLFQFDEFANQIATLLKSEDLPTPYSVVLHGEWGSGKTTLLRHEYGILQNRPSNKN
jgi:predicted KAP-like P-loop ATPase